jgi:RND family efflux transporter MFP subunit
MLLPVEVKNSIRRGQPPSPTLARSANGHMRGVVSSLPWPEPISFSESPTDMRFSSAATAAAAAALAVAVACKGGGEAPPGGMAFPPTAVKLATIAATNVEDATEYVGILKSLRSTTIQPQIDGQITRISVKSGDRVAAGEPLIQIDPRRQEAAVSSQEAERAAREAAVNFARQQNARASELYAAGAISKQELEQAETGLRTAEASLKALQAQVQQQEVQLRYYTISAPTSGIVGDIPVRVGMQVTTSTLLTTVDQNETLEVHVAVPLERSRELRKGLVMQIFSSDGQERFGTTAIDFISPHVEDQTQSILVKGTLRNPEGRLRASQFVRARVVFKTVPGIVIPVIAVLRISGQYFAFVAEDAGGKLVAKQRAIRVGPIVGNDYVVTDGLKPNERLIVSGVQKLADGAPIAPQL